MKELPVVRERGVCCAIPEVDQSWASQTAILLKALADPTRLIMVATLWQADQAVCICDFTASLELTQPTISHHMAKLKDAGLVDSEKDGIWTFYRLRQDLSPSTRRLVEQLVSAPAS
jgi:ArsR family transcriptional regulator